MQPRGLQFEVGCSRHMLGVCGLMARLRRASTVLSTLDLARTVGDTNVNIVGVVGGGFVDGQVRQDVCGSAYSDVSRFLIV